MEDLPNTWEELPEGEHDRSKPPGYPRLPGTSAGHPWGLSPAPSATGLGPALLPTTTAEPWKCLLWPQTLQKQGPRVLISLRHLSVPQLPSATITEFPPAGVCAPLTLLALSEVGTHLQWVFRHPFAAASPRHPASLPGTAPSQPHRQGAQSAVPQTAPQTPPAPRWGSGLHGPAPGPG